MKFITTIIISAILFSCNNSNNNYPKVASKEKNTKIQVIDKSFNFGSISITDSLIHDFSIINAGDNNLIIKSIKASCGCTVPTWDKKPIQPGDTTNVRIAFKPTAPGYNEKIIVVNCNIDSTFSVLYLRGDVTK